MEAMSSTGLPDLQTTDFQSLYSFNASEAKLEDDFLGSAVLQRHRGGHTLAMPSWTIVPMLYHAPPNYYTLSRTERPVDMGDTSETCKYIQEDELGTKWTISLGDKLEHDNAMQLVQNYTSEGLSDMKSVEYFKAVIKFDKALSTLWPCHINTPLEHWIKIHRGHALLRAALLQCPKIHGKKTSELLQMSFETLKECVDPLRGLQYVPGSKLANEFNRSLLFSGLLGLVWISFFRGNMKEAKLYINEAELVDIPYEHMRTYMKPKQRAILSKRSNFSGQYRPPVDIDTVFFQGALHRVIGSLDDIKTWQEKFGCELSDYEEDRSLVARMDVELLVLEGSFEGAVLNSTEASFNPKFEAQYHPNTTEVVADFLDRLQDGYSGNMWLTVGATRQAKAAYECAVESNSVLLHAAALVGLGNVFMRVIERSTSVGNGVTGVQSCTTVDKLKLGFAEAEKKYKEALAVYDELKYKEGQIKVQCNLGNLYHKQGQLQEALERYTTAKSYVSWKMDKGLPALHLHLKFAELHLDMKDWEKASDSIRKASNILIPSGKLSEGATSNDFARAWIEHLSGSYHLEKAMASETKEEQLMKDLSTARKHLEDAIKILTKIQVRIGVHTSLWLVIFEQQKETYARLLWCIACLSYNTSTNTSAIEVLVWCERSRSRALMVDWWDRYFKRLQEYLTDNNNDVAVPALTATADPNGTLLPYEESWRHLQVLLKRCKLPVATVVEYVLCADFGFLIFVLDIPEGEPKMLRVSFKEQGLDMEKLTELVDRTISLLDPKTIVNGKNGKREDEAEALEMLTFLYKLLIKPVEKWLKNTQQIIVIPHEVLFKVPFHALIDEKKMFLIERYTLSYEESLRSLVMHTLLWELNMHSRHVQDEHRNSVASGQKMKKKWLVVGINKHEPVAPNLNSAESEAQAVDSILGGVFEFESGRGILQDGAQDKAQRRLFRGSKEGATKEQVMPHFTKANIIHLATHGIINAKYERGGILFQTPVNVPSSEVRSSAAETFKTTKPSVLSASEMSSLRLEAQLVVLSACESAKGVILGEGVAGLGRALLQAGVPCTVLSLWRVSDKKTVDFMREFYQEFTRGISVADSMRVAMNTMINAKKAREYLEGRKYMVGEWAPFLVFGLPTVRVLASTTLPEPSVPAALKSQPIFNKMLGNIAALFLGVKIAGFETTGVKPLTRSAMTQTSVSCVWNPLCIKTHASTKPKSRGLLSLSEEKIVIFAIFAFHFQIAPS